MDSNRTYSLYVQEEVTWSSAAACLPTCSGFVAVHKALQTPKFLRPEK